MAHRIALVLAVLIVTLGTAATAAEVDPVKALVGTWQGEMDFRGVPADPARDPRRTLVIDSVARKDGAWAGRGRFGITGQPLGPVDIQVDTSGARPSLRFTNRVGVTVRLHLVSDRQLDGTAQVPGAGARSMERPLKLERAP